MRMNHLLVPFLALIVIGAGNLLADPVGYEFTYQGRINLEGSPLTGTADLQFTLWDASMDGSLIGATIELPDVSVSDGLFAVELDFGTMVFQGDSRWLQIGVRSPGGGEFKTISPRQPVTAVPYALFALQSSSTADAHWASNGNHIHSTNTGNIGIGTMEPTHRLDVRGSITSQQVSGNNDNFILQKLGGVGSSNASFRLSHRTNGTETWMYALGDTGFRNLQSWDYGNNRIRFPANGSDLVVDMANGRVGIGTMAPTSKLEVTSSEIETVRVINVSDSDFRMGVYGETASNGEGAGVYGRATSTSGFMTKGVWGVSDSHEGYGVWGEARSSTGSPAGVLGTTSATQGHGVSGSAQGTSGTGVIGWAGGSNGNAVWGSATHSTGANIAVGGQTLSPNGYAAYFVGRARISERLGIGVDPHASYRLALPNTASDSGRAIANRWDTHSSGRWKENVRSIDNALETVAALRGVRFDWKDGHAGDIGFIAEEVGEILPEIVTFSADGMHAEAMDYARVTPLLVEAVKAQQDMIEALRADNEILRDRLERVERAMVVGTD